MPTRLLSAVGSLQGVTGKALAADFLFGSVGLGEGQERGLNDSSAQAQHQMEGRFLWPSE